MHYVLSTMTIGDYDAVLGLWQATEGIGLSESDTREAVASFLQRNPGLSCVARDASGGVVGAVLCGHDGRRGYLHHLAVARACRGQGLGRRLVERCLQQLGALGILKCNVFLFAGHAAGESFWRHNGWQARTDLRVLQRPTPAAAQGRVQMEAPREGNAARSNVDTPAGRAEIGSEV